MSKTYRFAFIGIGANVFHMHRTGLEAVNGELIAAVDIDPARGQPPADELGCPLYTDMARMLAAHQPDIIAVGTPHPFHAEHVITGLEAGCHVLVEKPIAIQIKEVEAMIAAAAANNRILAVNFQQRLRPEIIAAQELIKSGQLGAIQNADMKMTWTRSAGYFASSSWRGTWNGEGGGVLLNQAPHELDLLCLLLGMPARVVAWTRNLVHPIETEDTIQVMVEWANGALGSIHISTAEAGQPQRFEIIGTGGHLSLGPGKVEFKRFDQDVRDYIATSKEFFSSPNLIPEPVELPASEGTHAAIYKNLLQAIETGSPVAADPRSASRGLELANAINYSSYKNQVVEFPLDHDAYAALLAELQASAKSK